MYAYEKRIHHAGLKAYRIIRGATEYDVETKAKLQCVLWDDKWRRVCEAQAKKIEKEKMASRTFQQKEWALERTKQAEVEMEAMGNLLLNGIEVDHVIDWEKLKDASPFSVPYPIKLKPFALPPEPAPNPLVLNLPLNWWQMLIPALRRRNEALMTERRRLAATQRQQVLDNWKEALAKVESANKGLAEAYKSECARWQSKRLSTWRLSNVSTLRLTNNARSI
jgi:restriction system protein